MHVVISCTDLEFKAGMVLLDVQALSICIAIPIWTRYIYIYSYIVAALILYVPEIIGSETEEK